MSRQKQQSDRSRLGDGPIARANARLRAVLEDIETALSAKDVPALRRIEAARAMAQRELDYRGED